MGDRTGSIEFTHLLHRGAPEPPQPALDHGSVRLSEGTSLAGDDSDGMRTPEMSLNIPEDNTDSHSPVHLEGELDSVQLKPGFK